MASPLQRLCSVAILLLATASSTFARTIACPNSTIQFERPDLDICNPLKYTPSVSLAVVATVLYALTAVGISYGLYRHGQKWMLTMIISCLCYAFGMGIRILFKQDTHATGVYIVLYLFTTLSPCGMLATDYILLGRLVRHLGMDKHLLINARKTTIIFVGSDIATFLVQAAGGGVSTAKGNPELVVTGTKIFLAGIILQLISFFFFTMLTLHFAYNVRKHEPALWSGTKEDRRWKQLLYALLWTCVGFLIRSFFRSVELSQGYGGFLAIHEVYIYALDTLPLFVAAIIYIPFYPGRYLRPNTAGAHPHAYDANGVLKAHAVPDEELPLEGTTPQLEEEKSRDGSAGAGEGGKRSWKRFGRK
ncbi:RTA1 like protein-domain-containing protein [Mrakia frigida]|uniref:RTA1 domain-containing protein n=1 Tax=Mrakia frigida TaxID=29902 RepID=UPI003FCC10AD